MKVIGRQGPLTLVRATATDWLEVGNGVHMKIDQCLLKRENYGDGSEVLFFSAPIYLLLNEYYNGKQNCKAIFFARKVLDSISPAIGIAQIRRKEQAALLRARVIPIISPPRFKSVILYPSLGEIAIAGYRLQGDKGWIVTEDLLNQCVKDLPELKDSGKIKKMYIVAHQRKSSQFLSNKPSQENCNTKQLIEVSYDEKSFTIESIRDLITNSEVTFTTYYLRGRIQFLNIGTRLPVFMRS